MRILVRIAFRNIKLNMKKSLVLGLTIFFCSFLLLTVNAAMNGAEKQVMKNYKNLQVGDIIVMWDKLKKTDASSPQRFINVYEALSFDVEENIQNTEDINEMNVWLDENRDFIKNYFPIIRRNATYQIHDKEDTALLIYSLSEHSKNYIVDKDSIKIKEGKLLSDEEGICISEDKATKYNIKLGDRLKISAVTSDNKSTTKYLSVSGIYENGAFYDNYYGFVSDKTARNLYNISPEYFDSVIIHLKDSKYAEQLASNLDKNLLKKNDKLRAESYIKANQYYNDVPKMIKMLSQVFIIFLLAVIGLGIQSTVKMNLFQRMKEFGTLRAIGFSRFKCYCIIFYETFFLSGIAFIVALLSNLIFVYVFNKTGVYVGAAASALFGGERFYPEIKMIDIISTMVIIIIFSLLATIRPGLNLCYQKLLDLLNKRQQRIHPLRIMIKELFRRDCVDNMGRRNNNGT